MSAANRFCPEEKDSKKSYERWETHTDEPNEEVAAGLAIEVDSCARLEILKVQSCEQQAYAHKAARDDATNSEVENG